MPPAPRATLEIVTLMAAALFAACGLDTRGLSTTETTTGESTQSPTTLSGESTQSPTTLSGESTQSPTTSSSESTQSPTTSSSETDPFVLPDCQLEWEELDPAEHPVSRAAAYIAMTAVEGYALAVVAPDEMIRETWKFEGGDWSRLMVDEWMQQQEGMRLAYDPGLEQVVKLVGEQTWIFVVDDDDSNDGWTLAVDTGPFRRSGSLAYFPDLNQGTGAVVTFGGKDESNEPLRELASWNGSSWDELAVDDGPTPRSGAILFHDSDARLLVLQGGEDKSDTLEDTWTWDGGPAWTQVADGTQTNFSVAAYHPTAHFAVKFAGRAGVGDGSATNALSVYIDGVGWNGAPVLGETPPARTSSTMAFLDGSFLVFGGRTGMSSLNDTWLLHCR